MAQTDEGTDSWDKVEASESFAEQIGKQHTASELSGDMGSVDSAEQEELLTMPDESLDMEEIGGFREQLGTSDDGQMSSEEFTAAAREQLEDESD